MRDLIHKLRAAAHGRNSVTHMVNLMIEAADALEKLSKPAPGPVEPTADPDAPAPEVGSGTNTGTTEASGAATGQ
jgi:hypothetical protein